MTLTNRFLLPRKMAAIFLMAVSMSILPAAAHSYLIPIEQLLGFMVKKIHRSRPTVITRSVHNIDPVNREIQTVFEERIRFDTPNLYYFETTSTPTGDTSYDFANNNRDKDLLFYMLFFARNANEATRFLSGLCINPKTETFTRLDKTIVYRIGGTEKDAPYLMIDKDKFLPLQICYYNDPDRDEMVVVRFSDYKKIGKRWFPLEITYRKGSSIVRRYIHTEIKPGKRTTVGCPFMKLPEPPCKKTAVYP